jgi:hypothetical protein
LGLNVIGTPSQIVTRGMLVRMTGTDRIKHLAQIRNMALTPLFQHYAAGDTPHTDTNNTPGSLDTKATPRQRRVLASSGVINSTTVSGQPDSSRRRLQTTAQLEAMMAKEDVATLPPGVLPWDPDYIVFINDVFFCAGQVFRLMNYQADMSCGMDYQQFLSGREPAQVKLCMHVSAPSWQNLVWLSVDQPLNRHTGGVAVLGPSILLDFSTQLRHSTRLRTLCLVII